VDLTNDDVADILALLDSLPYDSFDLRTDKFRLTLRRATSGGWTEESEILAEPTAITPAPTASSDSATKDSGPVSISDADADGASASGFVAVVAPLPGTFYRAPRPGAPPFVEVGDAVGGDTVVAIVETMKLMNSVHAGASGRVVRITADNGKFTPLGATLLLIEPDPA
jgi:acetyl-CoA carboxylase biotin carboxyl carrier protein